MRVVVHSRHEKDKAVELLTWIFGYFHKKNIEVSATSPLLERMRDWKGLDFVSEMKNASSYDLMISVGGDGTLLESVTYIHEHEVPIMGVNAGKLGFLATVQENKLEDALVHFLDGNYEIQPRALLNCKIGGYQINGPSYALNDFTVLKRDTSSMIVVDCYMDDHFLSRYWADGLIISTPTGSTGYSLSCGGPIVEPQSKNFIITAVSPHNLNVRPLVVSDNSRITLEVTGRSDQVMVSMDSRTHIIDSSSKIEIKRENFVARLIEFPFTSFTDTLRKKLNWGFDVRN